MFPSAARSHGPCKGYLDWLDSIFSDEIIRSAPLGPGKGKSVPRLPNPPVPTSSKPLKKHSIPDDDLVDRDPKHAEWGSTRRPDPVVMISPDAPIAATKDIVATPVVPSSEDEARVEVVDIEEPSDCMITEVADVEVPVAPTFGGVQHIESIYRDSLNEELRVVFSKARHVRDAQCSVAPPEVEDLRRQVIVRESVIIGPEAEHAEFVLEIASLEESIEKDRESRLEQLGIELKCLCTGL
ncbi:hypothetical protein LIER_26845 [Lithospermum erythrorhizon]|uniref:Uncharacterized protein n=1 Tax=Lithospermum erythrorhizon TaxID=34254 RepID=A0AAV3R9U7_LITER